MKIYFRVDSSDKIGSGHFSRCLCLAQIMRKQGADVTFISRPLNGSRCHWIREARFNLIELPEATGDFNAPAHPFHANWLEVPWEQDANECAKILKHEPGDLLVVDHYGIDDRWEKLMRPWVNQLVVIDDLADRTHDCDVLVDYGYSLQKEKRYKGLVPLHTSFLMGPEYVPLRPRFSELRAQTKKPNKIKRVGIFLGAAERAGVTERIVNAVTTLKGIEVDLLVGNDHPNFKWFQLMEKEYSFFHVLPAPMDTADWIFKCDLFVGAGGVSLWERACLKTPALTVVLAENQAPNCSSMAEAGFLSFLGHAAYISEEDFRQKISDALQNPASLMQVCEKASQLVDGKGAQRTVEYLFQRTAPSIDDSPSHATMRK